MPLLKPLKILTLLLVCQLAHAAPEQILHSLPKAVLSSLEKNQISPQAMGVSVMEILKTGSGKSEARAVLDWNASKPMNPASTMKLLTTLTSLEVLGPGYRWRTNLYTDGLIRQGVLKGNLYLQGSGDPKLIPEELAKMMQALQNLGIQKIDGNLVFDRSAYAKEVMEQQSIDGEESRAYNVSPDPLLYSFRTLSFTLSKSRTADFIDVSYTPTLSQLTINNQLRLVNQSCDNWKKGIAFDLIGNNKQNIGEKILTANFNGYFPAACTNAAYNVVAIDANTFLTKGFSAAWEQSGGAWAQAPDGQDGTVPVSARPLLQFEGIKLADDVQDINKFSNNVMARQVLLTLALEKVGKPASVENGDLVIRSWLKKMNLQFPELVIENGAGLSRNEAITPEHMNQLLVLARSLPTGDIFYNSLPIAGVDGTMRNRLLVQLRKFLHLQKKPEARIKTGSLSDVRSISGYVVSKSGKIYAVTSFINDTNANRGIEAQDQLLSWLLEDGPEPKQAR